jgi:K+-sensing histidine kinase KdpD
MPDGPTSIGLRIAVALAQQLGGRFRLEPAPDGGAMACLDLPQQTR